MRFRDRTEAGSTLAQSLQAWRGADAVVLGLPRGGVPVACAAADALELPLDVVIVRKLGVPFQPELAMGAIGEDGVRVLNEGVIASCHVTPEDLVVAERRERSELDKRSRHLRSARPREPLRGRTAIIVDDGLATGATAAAACQVARAHGASTVVLAAPVGAPAAVQRLSAVADHVVVSHTPRDFMAVGQFYSDFSQVSDDEVRQILLGATPGTPRDVTVALADRHLAGILCVPSPADGLVVFAHGSGSSRHSPRNLYVAKVLNQAGLATLLLDLLDHEEESNRQQIFDIDLLATRLSGAIAWAQEQTELRSLPIGLFGASTGSAAALMTAARTGSPVDAVVSRGGRPDLASDWLDRVSAPCLLIVGGADTAVVELNRKAAEQLRCEHRLDVIPGATHLFEEPGTLERVAELARDWFLTHLRALELSSARPRQAR